MSLPFVERSEARRLRGQLPRVDGAGSASRAYRAMLTQQVAPVLQEWGLEGTDERWEQPSAVWHLRLAFVPAPWATVGRLQFDVDVLAVPRVAWDQWRTGDSRLPEQPDAGVYYPHDVASTGGIEARLGELRSGHPDERWTVRGDQDPAPVAAEVLAAIHRYVVPAFAGRAEARGIAV